ncbi:MAG: hypothetical protein Q8L14_00360 [Myxococcales bacterium]|nr:hypothetical protein [Myxococcales bacterium]
MPALFALVLCQTLTALPHDAPVTATAKVSENRFVRSDVELPSAGLLLGRTALVPTLMALGAAGGGIVAFGVGTLIMIPFPPGQHLNRDPNMIPFFVGVGTMAALGAVAGLITACTIGSLTPRADLRVIVPIVIATTLLVGGAVVIAALLGAPLAPLLAAAGAVALSMPLFTAWSKSNQAREEFGLHIARF